METEIPPICKEYDSISSRINNLEEKISTLEEEIVEKTERIKEYLQILKDAKEVGLYPPLYNLRFEDDGSQKMDIVSGSVDFFQNKIQDFNDELLSNDEIIKNSNKELAELRKEREILSVEVQKTDYVKINYLNQNATSGIWVTKERYENNKLPCWRIV